MTGEMLIPQIAEQQTNGWDNETELKFSRSNGKKF